ncbi:MAG: guanylate kinase, partial [Clostridiales bacterium]|nr:guanylate kinase [Clostridiales bacterium]
MKRKGLLLVISGPSGAGKGTICKEFLENNKDVKLSVSATTRSPRDGEVDGVNYFFVTKDKFKEMIDNNELLEHAQIYDNFYGTPKAAILENLENGNDVVLEIEMQGARQIKEVYPEGVFIFILPPSLDELKNRIVG